jgi:hypothetical protein
MRLGGEMADTTDLKSVDRKVVRVRVPPQAPPLIEVFVSDLGDVGRFWRFYLSRRDVT